MVELVTLVVTNNPDFKDDIITSLKDEMMTLSFVLSINDVLPVIENDQHEISTILFEIPQKLDDFEKSIRTLKRTDIAKYIPFVGLHSEHSSQELISRQFFFHILTDPFYKLILPHTLESAQSDYKRYKALQTEVNSRNSAIGLIQSGHFRLQNLKEAEAVTVMLSLACPDPSSVALGLSEILVNAIEHGNLEISYEEKTILLETGEWDQEITKRLCDNDHKDKFVDVIFKRESNQILITITDQGNGFDWHKHVNSDPFNHSSKHGRGIALAIAMGFSNISYNEKGNQVTATVEF